jgi:hypothetical protein
MKSNSIIKNESADEKEKLIREIESKLIYSARYNIRVDVSFHDLMSETHKLLEITKPIEKYPNANKNQNQF